MFNPRRARAHGDDRPQLGDPLQPDRGGQGEGPPPLGCRHRGCQSPGPSHPAHRFRGDPRHDPDRADRVLGTDGLRHHGRACGRDGSDPRLPSGPSTSPGSASGNRSPTNSGKTSRRTSRRSPSPCWKRQPESDVSRRRHQEKAPRRRGAAPTPGHTRTPEAICLIDPAILSPLSALLGALIGGSAPVVAAIYTQRSQNHVQRIAAEVAKRETVYADFVASASTLILNAYTHDDITLGGEQQRIIGLINRMRLFAPPDVIKGADAVVRTIVDISLKPSVELRQLAQEALSRSS